jgi:hypothetical protein
MNCLLFFILGATIGFWVGVKIRRKENLLPAPKCKIDGCNDQAINGGYCEDHWWYSSVKNN